MSSVDASRVAPGQVASRMVTGANGVVGSTSRSAGRRWSQRGLGIVASSPWVAGVRRGYGGMYSTVKWKWEISYLLDLARLPESRRMAESGRRHKRTSVSASGLAFGGFVFGDGICRRGEPLDGHPPL